MNAAVPRDTRHEIVSIQQRAATALVELATLEARKAAVRE